LANHVWDINYEAQGPTPVTLPTTPGQKPSRNVQASHPIHMAVHYRCSWCGVRAVERFQLVRVDAKPLSAAAVAKGIVSRPDGIRGDKHEVHDYQAVETVPAGPCSGRPA
jgi:hypothetical protein